MLLKSFQFYVILFMYLIWGKLYVRLTSFTFQRSPILSTVCCWVGILRIEFTWDKSASHQKWKDMSSISCRRQLEFKAMCLWLQNSREYFDFPSLLEGLFQIKTMFSLHLVIVPKHQRKTFFVQSVTLQYFAPLSNKKFISAA